MQDGNVFYRRQQLYSVQGKFPRLDDYIIAGCRYGGPLGIRVIPYCAMNLNLISFILESIHERSIQSSCDRSGDAHALKNPNSNILTCRGHHPRL